MAEMIKIRCNGPKQHVNEIDLGEVLSVLLIAATVLVVFRLHL